jgi:recombinational DNA repair protein RecR
MPTAVAGPEIERLIQLLARLPGLGPRSARRAALHLIKKRELLMAPLAGALQTAMEKIVICKTCGNIDTQNPCTVCTDGKRDQSIIVVVADVADLWALERAHAVNGRYPDTVPLSTVPPEVLQTMPKLSEDMEYRFIGDDLILLDTHAHVIADYIENALPR